jgi:hypothetical protein
VSSDGILHVILLILIFLTSTGVIFSDFIFPSLRRFLKIIFRLLPLIHHPYAFGFIGAPFVFHAQNMATFEGVYVANRQSLGSCLPSPIFISDVPLFHAYFNHGTLKFHTRVGGKLSSSDRIFRIKYATH